jgi:hypothetical protein
MMATGLNPSISFGQGCADVTRQNRLSVIYLEADKTTPNTGAEKVIGGTGFVVSPAGIVLTNKHVVAPEKPGDQVAFSGAIGSRAAQLQPMHLLAMSPTSDLALLQFDDTSKVFKPIIIGNPGSIDIDHPVCSMSFPLDIEFLIEKGSVTGKGAPNGWWYTNMASNLGDSGAPVFDATDGRVVAVQVGDRDDARGLSYIIPINQARSLMLDYVGLDLATDGGHRDSPTPTQYSNTEVNCTKSTVPFARDYCSVVQCPNGQWVRGSAKLMPGGDVVVSQGLETDRLDLGICGWVEFRLLDSSDKVLAYGHNSRTCIPAKAPGKARIENLEPTHVRVPAPIANKVATIQTSSFCAGDQFAPFGLGPASGPSSSTLSVVIGSPPK